MRVIVTNDLTKTYGNHFTLSGINLQVNEGEFLGLVGNNGAGKTTLLRLLSGTLRPTSGEAYILGHTVKNVKDISHLIGVVHQTTSVSDHLTVKESLEMEAQLRNINRDAIYEAVSLAKLDDLLDRRIGKLSLGSKRKISIVKALMHNPTVLMLDEPSVGLDPIVRRWIWDYLKGKKKQNMACVISTHYLDEAEYLCDRVLLMKNNDGYVESRMLDLESAPATYHISATIREVSHGEIQQVVTGISEDGRKVSYSDCILTIETAGDPYPTLTKLLEEFQGLNIKFREIHVSSKSIQNVLVAYCSIGGDEAKRMGIEEEDRIFCK